MALIKCSECDSQVSDLALSCPKCGCPVKNSGSQPPALQQIASAGSSKLGIQAGQKTYKELADIAERAALKLLTPFAQGDAKVQSVAIEEILLSFLVYADDFTETCCQQFANIIRRASVLAEVRGTPTTALARQIREDCFAKTDRILASYLEALRGCHIDLKSAAQRLQETSVLGAALRGAGQGQLAGGLGNTGAAFGVFGAAIAGLAESEKQAVLLWEQRKAIADAKNLASRKMVEYLESIKQVTETLLDFGCAKCFGGEVDFVTQSEALGVVEKAISAQVVVAIARVVELTGSVEVIPEDVEEDPSKSPPNDLPETLLGPVKALLGKEARGAIIYQFDAQIGLAENQLVVALTGSRVWFGGIKRDSTDIVEILSLPYARLREISQFSKSSFFWGEKSTINLKYGGWLDIAILKSSKEQGEYFYGVLKRRLLVVNQACTILCP